MSDEGNSALAALDAQIQQRQEYLKHLRTLGAEADKVPESVTRAAQLELELNSEIGRSMDANTRALKQQELVRQKRIAQLDLETEAQKKIIKGRRELPEAGRLHEPGSACRAPQAAEQEAANAVFGKSEIAIEALKVASIERSIDLDKEALAAAEAKFFQLVSEKK